jgi:chemotaxis family two-component system response regulator Rcp1
MHNGHSHVLLVEDNPSDLRLTKEAFQDLDPLVILDAVSDGAEALAFLRRSRQCGSPCAGRARPKMDGRQVLNFIKTDASLRTIPTIVLSISDEQSDVQKSYELQANCYLSKPKAYDEFASLIRGVVDFWLTKAKLPS